MNGKQGRWLTESNRTEGRAEIDLCGTRSERTKDDVRLHLARAESADIKSIRILPRPPSKEAPAYLIRSCRTIAEHLACSPVLGKGDDSKAEGGSAEES